MFVAVCRLRNCRGGSHPSGTASRQPRDAGSRQAPMASRGRRRRGRPGERSGESRRQGLWERLAWGLLPHGVGMGTGERRTGVRNGSSAPFLGIRRPRVAGRIPPPGRGASPWRPVTAHLRETAPRSSTSKTRNRLNDALTRIEPMRYGSCLSGVSAHVGVIDGGSGKGLRSGRRSRSNVEGSREGPGRNIRGRRDLRSRSGVDRPHGDAEGVREGRRVRIGSPIGTPRPELRAGSLVRRCKGGRDVVSSHEVPRSR
jgi:hypothetical protein